METNERLARVETNIENIKDDVVEIKDMLKSHVKWEEDKYKDMEELYASKWVEKVVIGIIIAVGGSLFGLIMFLK